MPTAPPLPAFGLSFAAGLLLAPRAAPLLPVLAVLGLGQSRRLGPAAAGAIVGVLLGLGSVRAPTSGPRTLDAWPLPACHRLEGHVREVDVPQQTRRHLVLSPVRIGEGPAALDLPTGIRLAVPLRGAPPLRPGDRIRVPAWVGRIPRATNPGQMDPALREARRGVSLRGFVEDARSIRVLERSRSLKAGVTGVRFTGARRLDARLDSRDAGLARALLLGDRGRLEAADRDRFRRTGQGHLLAVSGLHVGMLLAAVLAGTRILCLGPRLASAVGLSVVLLYVPLVGAPPSAVRAGTGAALLFGGRLLGRRTSGAGLLAAVVVVVLGVDPGGAHDPALLLSLFAVTGILLLSPRIRERLVPEHPVVPGIVEPSRAPLRSALAVALGAWLGVAPLLALHLGRVNPWAAPLSVLAVPLTALTLAGGGVLLAAPAVLGLDRVSAVVFGAAADLLRTLLDVALGLGAEALPAEPPGSLWLGLYGASLLVAARGRGRVALAASMLVPLLLALVLWPRTTPPPGHPRLLLLDVGHGQAALLSLPDGRHALLDVGRVGDPQVGRRRVVPALRTLGVRRLALVSVSHLDEDHAGGLEDVLRALPVDRLVIPAPAVLPAELRPEATGVPFDRVAEGATLLEGAWGQVVVLHPPRRAPADLGRNDGSLVLRVDTGERGRRRPRALLPGDLQQRGAAMLVDAAGNGALRVDVLVLPHHGRLGRGRDVLMRACRAQVLLASTGRSVLEDLPHGTLATGAVGAVEVRLAPHRASVRTPFARRATDDYHRAAPMYLALSTPPPPALLLYAALLVAFAGLSVRPFRWLQPRAAAAACALGMSCLLAFGVAGLAALFAPFLVATLLGKLPGPGREGPRALRQVLANGLPAFLGVGLALLGWVGPGFVLFLGSLSCLGADTCATELGVRYGGTPRLAISGRSVAPGESGGVTPLGFLASVVGACLAPLVAVAIDGGSTRVVALFALAGVLAAWLDSALGATLQYRGRVTATGRITEKRRTADGPTERVSGLRWLDNDAVNLVTGFVGGILAVLLVGWLGN